MYPEYEVKKKVNGGAVARIVIWSVVLVLLVGVFAGAMVLGGDGIIHLGGYVYEDADSYNVGNGEITDTVTALDVDWIDGSVSIVPTDGDKIIVREDYQDDQDELRLRWKVENGKLTVKYRKSGRTTWGKENHGKALTVEVPEALLKGMNEVEISIVSADLLMTDMTARETDIDMVSGDVVISGDFGELDIDTVSGDVKLEGSAKSMDVDGTSATIELLLNQAPATIDVDTVSGNVSLLLPAETTGFEANVDAVSGTVSVHGFDDVTKTKDYCRFGDGSVKINVDAVSGNLKIDKNLHD